MQAVGSARFPQKRVMKAQERQLSLVAYLHHHRFGRTLDEILADIPAYGTGDAARKKLQRDKSLLGEIGLHLHVVEQPGQSEDGNLRYAYVLDRRQTFARGLRLAPREREHLLLLCERLMARSSFAFGEWIRSAREKLLAAGLQDSSAVRQHAPVDSVATLASPAEEEALDVVLRALESGHCLAFTYQALQQDLAEERVVHGRQLCAWKGRWMLKGWCELRGGPRSFLLQRMRQVRVSPIEINPALPFEEADRSPGWEFGLGEGPVAELEFNTDAAPLVRRQLRLSVDAQAQEDPGARMRLSLPVGQPALFFSWLLSWGRQARLLGPPELQIGLKAWLEGQP